MTTRAGLLALVFCMQQVLPGYSETAVGPELKKLTRVVEDGNPAKAIKPLKEIIAKEPDNFAAHVCLGRAYFWLDQSGSDQKDALKLARQQFVFAAKLRPNNGKPYCHLGEVCAAEGNFDEALRQFKRSLDVARPYVGAYRSLALTYSDMGKFDLALEQLDKYLELKPPKPGAYKPFVLRATFLERLKRYDEAALELDKALKVQNTDDLKLKKAQYLANAKKPKQAVALLDQVLRQNPQDETAYLDRARYKLQDGDARGALIDCNKALTLMPSASAYRLRAAINEKLGNKQAAAADKHRSN